MTCGGRVVAVNRCKKVVLSGTGAGVMAGAGEPSRSGLTNKEISDNIEPQ